MYVHDQNTIPVLAIAIAGEFAVIFGLPALLGWLKGS